MNDMKQVYESPSAEVIPVRMESRILEGSITGERQQYGPAQEEVW